MREVLKIRGLSFCWPKQRKPILAIEDFELQAGERCFLQGPSGSGKSTLLNLIAGVMLPQQGEIEVLGTSLKQLSHAQRDRFRAEHLGFIFQMFNLLPYLSVLDNVLLALNFAPERRAKLGGVVKEAERLLEQLALTPYLNQAAHTLSIGQQQRVAAVRALLGAPALLIADEPTSALDSDNRQAFLDLLLTEAAKYDIALLFVSHDHSLANAFDRHVNLAQLNQTTIDLQGLRRK
ncbi:MAG: ABC transporter ATP-binding protein [Deinococcales bacterium]